MSLDTVLEIGKALRNSKEGLYLFKYFKGCEKDDDDTKVIRFNLPVKEDGTFVWNELDIIPENKVDELIYLDYRTSDQDSSPKKYLFGDVFYSRSTVIDRSNRIKKPSEYGNFTFEKGKAQNAFLNGKKVFIEIKKDFLENYLERVLSEIKDEKDQKSFIKAFLKDYLNDQEIILPKKIASHEDKIEPVKNKIESILENIQLFKFHDQFELNRSEVDKILFYAPAFYKIIEKGEDKLGEFLNDKDRIEETYLEAVFESDGNYIKKLFKNNETSEKLSSQTKYKILSYSNFKVFLHFDFIDGHEKKHWYQFEKSTNLLKQKLNSELVESTDFGLVPQKSIYRTLCSGDDKNDIQFPNFIKEERHKSFSS